MLRYFPMTMRSLLTLIAVGALSSSLLATEPLTNEGIRFFESKIRPILVNECQSCHGPEKQRSDLRLDRPAGLARGGSSGEPLISPTQPEQSFLLRTVRHDDDAPAMPPKKKLSAAQIADLTRWVKMGAPYPEPVVQDPAADPKNHWAFQPLQDPAVPEHPAVHPIDRFLGVAMAAKGLKPAPAADRATLLRRVTFDLTGLPPTQVELEAFLADTEPEAFSRVVDRLLASPAYGERWGRHWLDVARYADSNGLDENIAHGNAWRYRDYVIAAFNNDKPFDQFLREQIAGDLLPASSEADRRENLIALGFLSLGAKVLAEPDARKMELDIVDEQIDTLGKAFLGLTLGCARCHDHKFDPITIDDYYALAGIFTSSKTMESFKIVARWHENSLGSVQEQKRLKEHQAKIAAVKEEIKALTGKTDEVSKKALNQAKATLKALEDSIPDVPSAMGVTEGQIADAPLLRRGDHLNPGPIVPRRFPEILAGTKQPPLPKDHSGRLELARWLSQPDHPLTSRVIVNRVWRWHFGRGIVASVDNFGLLGDRPSHPALLDWLAQRFVESGWSIKALHRLILLSDAYQRSSAYDAAAATTDPQNTLLWRFSPRRLQAEEIRDALLAVSGALDPTAGGPALTHVKNRDYLFNHTSKDQTTYHTNRRTVYLPVIRNNLYDVLQLFDATDATVLNGDRPTTTVATQALFWMNSPLIRDAATRIAENLLSAKMTSDAERIREIVRSAYCRDATPQEIERYTRAANDWQAEFTASEPDPVKRRLRAWAAVIQVILSANEFVTLR